MSTSYLSNSKINMDSISEQAFYIMKEFKLVKTLEQFEKLSFLDDNSFKSSISFNHITKETPKEKISFIQEISSKNFKLDYLYISPSGIFFKIICEATLLSTEDTTYYKHFHFKIKPISMKKIDFCQ